MRLSQCITRAAQVAPARIATAFGERSHSWEEVSDRVARLAAVLRQLGVESGDGVAFLGANSDRYVEWFFAVGWADAVVVPVSVRLAAPEIRQVVNDSGARVLFVDEQFAPLARRVRDDVSDLCELVYADDGEPPAGGWHSLTAALERHGIDHTSVERRKVPFPEVLPALDAGRVDAAFLATPFKTIAERSGNYRAVGFNIYETTPELIHATYFVAREWADHNERVLERFHSALRKAMLYAADHPQETREAVGELVELPENVIDASPRSTADPTAKN